MLAAEEQGKATSRARSGIRHGIERAELLIYVTTSVVLIVTAAGFLAIAVVDMIQHTLAGDYIRALLQVLDRALLVLMLAEII